MLQQRLGDRPPLPGRFVSIPVPYLVVVAAAAGSVGGHGRYPLRHFSSSSVPGAHYREAALWGRAAILRHCCCELILKSP
jgi:hypothetical protein